MIGHDVRIGILAPSRSLAGTTEEQVRDLNRTLADQRALPMRLLLFPGGVLSAQSVSTPDIVDRSRSRLDDLRRAVGAQCAFVLPGPWDARPVERSSRFATAGVSALRRWDEHDCDEFWNDAGSPQRRLVDESFAQFKEPFAAGQLPSDFRHGLVPGDCSFSLELDDLHIGVVALNTVFLAVATGGKTPDKGWEISSRQLAEVCDGQDPFAFAARHDALVLLTYASRSMLSESARQEYDAINSDGRFAVHASANDGDNSHVVRGRGALEAVHLALGPDPVAGGGRGVAAIEFQMRSGGIVATRARSWQVRAREEDRASLHARASLRRMISLRTAPGPVNETKAKPLREALAATYPSREYVLELANRERWPGAWDQVAGPVEDLWGAIVHAVGEESSLLRKLSHRAREARSAEDLPDSSRAGAADPSLRTIATEVALRKLLDEMLPTRELLLAFSDELVDVTGLGAVRLTREELCDRLFERVSRRNLLERLQRWDPTLFKRRAEGISFESMGARARASRLGSAR